MSDPVVNEKTVPVEAINTWLKNNYGNYDGKAKFRIVYANDEMEKRLGTFVDFVPGTDIFLREVTEVREVKKYSEPNFKDAYVIEKLVPNYHVSTLGRLSYEPIWSYDKRLPDGSIKHPTFQAVQYFMKMSIEGPSHTREFWNGLAEQQDQETLSYYENLFDNEEGFGYKKHSINSEFERQN